MIDASTGPAAWLFIRDAESVRLLLQRSADRFRLVIFGPGENRAEFDFAEIENLDRFRQQYERDLKARGFVAESMAERRGHGLGPPFESSATDRRR